MCVVRACVRNGRMPPPPKKNMHIFTSQGTLQPSSMTYTG